MIRKFKDFFAKYLKGNRMYDKLSKNFSRLEFACHCGCGADKIDPDTVRWAQKIRDHFRSPCSINSGVRCLEHNRKQGSKDTSQHVQGCAADIAVKGVAPKAVADWLTEQGFVGGLGRYKTFTHFDLRGKNARWGKN